jgi:arsenate reductase
VSGIVISGIRNCDTVRKARAWLDGSGVGYVFHDYRSDGLDPALRRRWCRTLGGERLLNRPSTTFRRLAAADRGGLDAHKALRLMRAQPALIRRPALEAGGALLVGFRPEAYARVLPRS